MAARVKTMSKTVVWVIVALLIVGLAGFGATSFSGTTRTLGVVGDQSISVDDFARDLQREMRSIEAQTGTAMTVEQARAYGLDQMVLNRLVQFASLDDEAAQMGLSLGDTNLQREIMNIDAFKGIDGKFDRETYRFALQQANLKEVDFEKDLRAEGARTILQQAIGSGIKMPAVLADRMTDYVAARRSFTWASLDEAALPEPLAQPTDADLQTYFDAHGDQFVLPETKKLTYVLLTPEMILGDIEVDEAAVQKLYDERSTEYQQPERRLVERLVFSDEQSASDAKAQLEVGGTTFEALVQNRGLSLSDIDLGDVTRDDVGAAADDVFSAEVGDVVGPLPSDLGPALFRVNGKLEARTTPLDEVRQELHDELALEGARRQIESRAEPIEDMLAGGATLEEVGQETEMELGQMEWNEASADGPAAYPGFKEAAAAVQDGDFPEIGYLEDGSIYALRLDETLPERPEPFDSARDKVAEEWTKEQLRAALSARAETLAGELKAGTDFTDTGLEVRVENGLTRTAFIDGTPADFMNRIFAMEPGDYQVIPSDETVLLVRLDETLPPAEGADVTRMRDGLSEQLDQALAQAIFAAYVRDVQLRARPRVDQDTLAAVMASFN